MTEKEKIIKELKKYINWDNSDEKKFWDDIQAALNPVTEHLILIILFPNDINYNHWCTEIYGSFSQFFKLSYMNNKYPTKADFESVFMNT